MRAVGILDSFPKFKIIWIEVYAFKYPSEKWYYIIPKSDGTGYDYGSSDTFENKATYIIPFESLFKVKVE